LYLREFDGRITRITTHGEKMGTHWSPRATNRVISVAVKGTSIADLATKTTTE
jgi:hypothetical protein